MSISLPSELTEKFREAGKRKKGKIALPEDVLNKFKEAGRRGGLKTKEKMGPDFYSKIGALGAAKTHDTKGSVPNITELFERHD